MDDLIDGFAALLAQEPPSIVCCTPSRTWSCAEIAARARTITAPGEIVALALPNGPQFLATLLALRRANQVALLLDATLPEAARLRTARTFGAGSIVDLDGIHPIASPEPQTLPPGTAVVKLSSGSTGAPRGIAQSAKALRADAAQLRTTMGITRADRALAIVPMSFSYGLSSLAVPALCEGLTLVIPEDDGPLAPLRAAEACAATVLLAVPVFLQGLLKLSNDALPGSIRRVISAGAPLAPELARAFRERFGRKVHAFYGASECGGICYDRTGDAAERGTVGTPVDGVRVTLQPNGQVAVESAAVALGYVPFRDQDPGSAEALAAGRFVASDCARFEHGELRLLGRNSECINVDGRKVHPREIERVLQSLPGVDEALVVREDEPARGGESCWALVACAQEALTRAHVLEWCRAHLPPHKVPRRVTLMRAIPRNSRGKVDLDALRSPSEGTGEGTRV